MTQAELELRKMLFKRSRFGDAKATKALDNLFDVKIWTQEQVDNLNQEIPR